MTTLQPEQRHIVLIGFMGTGKTTVGNRLAREMNRPFVDIDHEIEKVAGMAVSEIFRKYGEKRFRSEESLATARLAARSSLVISTGGGWVLKEENVQVLKPVSLIVWLTANPGELYNRVMRKKHSRPLLKNIHSAADLETMMNGRRPFYEKAADLVIDTGVLSLRQVVNEIMSTLSSSHRQED